jgi:hypothetical protein
LFLIRDIRAIRAPLDFLQGDYLCSFVVGKKIPNFPRYIAPDFLQYITEDETNNNEQL